jgi:hypothetical protein
MVYGAAEQNYTTKAKAPNVPAEVYMLETFHVRIAVTGRQYFINQKSLPRCELQKAFDAEDKQPPNAAAYDWLMCYFATRDRNGQEQNSNNEHNK